MRDMIVHRYLEREGRKNGGRKGLLKQKGRALGRNYLKISVRQ